MKVFIAHSSAPYADLFKQIGFTITNSPDEAGLGVFTGGADVTPAMYGDKKHHYTGNDERRDREEYQLAKKFQAAGIPMVGICRGGQFLNVVSGGRMYQHVGKHATGYGHSITDLFTGETINVSSTHHQMIMPSDKAVIVATANLGGYREWYDGEISRKDVSKEDIEVVFYEHTKCLCFQPHPEFNGAEYEGMKSYFRSLLKRYLEA